VHLGDLGRQGGSYAATDLIGFCEWGFRIEEALNLVP
jgi:hypothetical protein